MVTLFSLALVLVCMVVNQKSEPYTEAEIAFSVEENFLSESQELTLSAPCLLYTSFRALIIWEVSGSVTTGSSP